MDLTALRVEFIARGFGYIDASGTTRQDGYLNRSYWELCEEANWPFLEATSSGAAPLTINDLRTIEYVTHATTQTKLVPMDRRAITDSDYVLTTTGSPYWYYVSAGTIVNVYPANTGSITVRYYKVPTVLSTGSDTPLLPTRFHLLIVDGAVAYAYLDSDNPESAKEAFGVWEAGKERMRGTLLEQQVDMSDDFVVVTAGSVDG